MGDGDEGMKTSPRLFFLVLRIPADRCVLCPGCPPCPLSLSLGCRAFVLSPLCLSSVGACGGAWPVVSSCDAVRRVARRLCRSAGRRAGWLLVYVHRLYIRRNRRRGGRLTGVPRLVAQCGRRGACPAVFVSVNRCGRRGGSLAVICLLG